MVFNICAERSGSVPERHLESWPLEASRLDPSAGPYLPFVGEHHLFTRDKADERQVLIRYSEKWAR